LQDPISKIPITKKKNKKQRGGRLVEWLKVKALSSSSSTTKKKEKVKEQVVYMY
jgi:hypothetical protein